MTVRITRREGLFGMGALGLFAGCASPTMPLNPDIAPISFDGAPFPLRVETIRLLIRPRVPVPNAVPIDADFVVPVEEVARLWPSQRLQAIGGPLDATYTIDDANAISRPTPEGEIVVGTIQVRLVLNDRAGVEQASAGARVESELRIGGAPSIVERQEMLHRMAVDMAAELDTQMAASVNRTLRQYSGPPLQG
jgi:hypothetical protein